MVHGRRREADVRIAAWMGIQRQSHQLGISAITEARQAHAARAERINMTVIYNVTLTEEQVRAVTRAMEAFDKPSLYQRVRRWIRFALWRFGIKV